MDKLRLPARRRRKLQKDDASLLADILPAAGVASEGLPPAPGAAGTPRPAAQVVAPPSPQPLEAAEEETGDYGSKDLTRLAISTVKVEAEPEEPSTGPIPDAGAKRPSLDKAGQEAQTPFTAAPVPQPPKGPEPPAEEDVTADLFSSLFKHTDEKEESPLDRLVAHLPENSMDDIMAEIAAIKLLMAEWPATETQGGMIAAPAATKTPEGKPR